MCKISGIDDSESSMQWYRGIHTIRYYIGAQECNHILAKLTRARKHCGDIPSRRDYSIWSCLIEAYSSAVNNFSKRHPLWSHSLHPINLLPTALLPDLPTNPLCHIPKKTCIQSYPKIDSSHAKYTLTHCINATTLPSLRDFQESVMVNIRRWSNASRKW